jgi:succinylglutamate desuccinylase
MITFGFGGNQYQTKRVVGDIQGSSDGPTLVFVGGIHGNEPSGVIAIQRLFADLQDRGLPIRGRVLGIVGNMAALAENRRYLSRDLNRVWDQDFFTRYKRGDRFETNEVAEYREACEIFNIIAPILLGTSEQGPDQPASPAPASPNMHQLYFFDLHTTSAPTVPFIAINDQLNNRKFALKFSVPTVLGIEEYLRGPLLSYLNDFGPVAFAFEAGQHNDPSSADIHLAFIRQALVLAGVLDKSQVPSFSADQKLLESQSAGQQGIVEVVHRHHVEADSEFRMEPGFHNFTRVEKGQKLATDRHGPIHSAYTAKIFMPLYQSACEDGFFIVRDVPRAALTLSTFLRQFRFDRLLVALPGVSRSRTQPDALVINKKVARFLAVELFHLLGYRRKRDDGDFITFVRREVGTL